MIHLIGIICCIHGAYLVDWEQYLPLALTMIKEYNNRPNAGYCTMMYAIKSC